MPGAGLSDGVVVPTHSHSLTSTY